MNPYTTALEAGLNPDSPCYRGAMEYLQAEGVLEWAEETHELVGKLIYTITLRGMQMLQEDSDPGLLDELQDRIRFLEEELADRKEEARRKDTIIVAQMNQTIQTTINRIPELEAPSEPSECL